MPKETISDEEFDRLEGAERHESLLAALEKAATRNDSESLGKLELLLAEQLKSLLSTFNRKDFSTDLKPLIEQLSKSMNELKGALANRPKSFLVIRNKQGFIERVVVEK